MRNCPSTAIASAATGPGLGDLGAELRGERRALVQRHRHEQARCTRRRSPSANTTRRAGSVDPRHLALVDLHARGGEPLRVLRRELGGPVGEQRHVVAPLRTAARGARRSAPLRARRARRRGAPSRGRTGSGRRSGPSARRRRAARAPGTPCRWRAARCGAVSTAPPSSSSTNASPSPARGRRPRRRAPPPTGRRRARRGRARRSRRAGGGRGRAGRRCPRTDGCSARRHRR